MFHCAEYIYSFWHSTKTRRETGVTHLCSSSYFLCSSRHHAQSVEGEHTQLPGAHSRLYKPQWTHKSKIQINLRSTRIPNLFCLVISPIHIVPFPDLQHRTVLKDVLFITDHTVLVECGDPLLWVLHYLYGQKAQWCLQLARPPVALMWQ